MILFAGRPQRTYFSDSPLGWYLYRWEVATTPAYVEWQEGGNFAFIAVHLVVVLAAVVLVLKAGSRRQD